MGRCFEPLVTVVVPTYNEAGNIGVLLERLFRALESRGIGCFEVIVVDDDSPDGTWRVVEEYSRRDGRVRLVRRLGERGLNGAIVRGVSEASSENVIVMDADLQHPPEKVPDMAYRLARGECDVVVASRIGYAGSRGWGLYRRLISKAASLAAWILIPESRKTRDPMSGFFGFKKSLAIPVYRPRGFKVLLSILSFNPSARVCEEPYVFGERLSGYSKLTHAVMAEYVAELILYSKPLRFALVGGSGALVNLALMALLLGATGDEDVSSIAGIEASILWNFALHEAWTFRYRFRGGLQGVVSRLAGYHLAVVWGAATTYLVMKSLHEYLGFNPLLGQASGIIAGYIVNYLMSRRLAWRR